MDQSISLAMAALLGQSILFDETILMISASHLVKGAALVAAMVLIWTLKPQGASLAVKDALERNRATILAALLASAVAQCFARILSNSLEFRLRPFLEPSLAMEVPGRLRAMAPEMMLESSFPSDHAILFFAVATGVYLASRPLGLAAFVYSAIFIALPRVYLGLHYMSDILVGAAIGIAFAWLGVRMLRNTTPLRILVRWADTVPHLFYPVFFLFLYQVATMLEDLRAFSQLLKLV